MALPALLGAGARAVGGSMVKTSGRAVAAKVLGRGRKKQAQPGRIVPGREGVDGGKGGAIIKPNVKMVSAKEIKALQTGDTVSPGKDPLKSIYSNVILIEKILKGNNIADRDALKEKKKNDKKSDKAAQEKKLETKPPKIDKKKGEVMKLPETGVFGWIKNFIGNILMGYFAVRLIKYLPQIMGLLKGLGRVVEFVTDVGMFLVDGIASFINFAYNVYDGTRNIFKSVGLEGAFDGIMKAVEVAITVLTFALGAKSLGGFGGGRGGTAKTPKTRVRTKPQEAFQAGRPKRMQPPGTTSQGAASRYARRYGEGAAKRRFGQEAGKKAAKQAAGKLGVKGAARVLGPLVKRVPVIGGLVEFVLSVVSGDSVGKAAFRAVGSGLGTWIGGALGSLIPVPFVGTAIGAFVGGAGGSELAGAMYDAFFGGKEKQPDPPEEPEAKQSGGEVGRGFQEDTLRQQKKAIRKKPSYSKIKAPEGGKIKTGKKTEKAWWDFLGWAGTGGQEETMQLGPGGQMLANRVVNLGNSFGEYPYFGPILSLAAKVMLGETPNEEEYKNVGYGLNMLIGEGVTKGKIGEGIKGYEDGGMIDDYYAMAGIDVGRWATDTFKKELSTTLNKSFDVMKPGSTAGPGTPAGVRDPATGELVPGTGTSGTPFSGSMKGAQIGEQHLLDAMKKLKYTGDPAVLMAIVKGESKFQAKEEDMYVSAQRAYEIFGPGRGNRITSIQHAQELISAGKKAFFDHVYQPKYVPMNEKPDDGYRYIGRGHIQLTGRSNYRDIGKIIGRNLEEDPLQILNNPTVSAEAAVGFMIRAQKYGQGVNDIESALRAVGGWTGGWPDKRKYYQEYKQKIASGQIGQNTPATPNVQPSQSGQQPQQQQPGQIGEGSEAVQKLLKDFPQIKSRGSSQQIYASALGYYLKKSGAGRPGTGDYGDPPGGDMEHPDHGGVVASHAGTGHYRGVALDLGANSATSGSYTQDQKTLWPYISKFLHKYGLHKDPYVPQVIHGPKESFSPKAASSFADGAHHNHFHVEFHKGGLVGGDGEVPAVLKSGEIVIDNDSSISKVAPMLLAINKAKDEKGVMNAIRNYAPYEAGAQQTIMIQDPPQQMPEESPQSSGGMMVMSGGSSHDPFEFLDFQG
jgi:predicted chitinase